MPSLPKHVIGPIKHHGWAPVVVMQWRKYETAILIDVETLRKQLAQVSLAAEMYPEHLLSAFANSAMEEQLLHAQFVHTMLRVMDAQARKLDFRTWSPVLTQALKVSATLKAPRHHKLLTLKEITRLTNPALIPEKEVTLHDYLASIEDRDIGSNSRIDPAGKRTEQRDANITEDTNHAENSIVDPT